MVGIGTIFGTARDARNPPVVAGVAGQGALGRFLATEMSDMETLT